MLSLALSLCFSLISEPADSNMLPIGKRITPLGTHVNVGSFPANMVLSPNKKWIVVTNTGYREFLTVLDSSTGEIKSKIPFEIKSKIATPETGLYFGLSFARDGLLYVSHGATDKIGMYRIDEEGQLSREADPILNKAPVGSLMPNNPAGLAVTPDGTILISANNQTSHTTDYKGSVSFIDTATKSEISKVTTSAFPFALTMWKDRKAYVAGERDNIVDVIDVQNRKILRQIKVGANPEGLALSPNLSVLYVANYGSDTLSVVDTSTDKVRATIMLRPVAMSGLPGAGPTGLTVSPDGKKVYVALQDMMSVAVVNAVTNKLEGYLPAGWNPTSVICTQESLFVSNGKGVRAVNPNNKPVGELGTSIKEIIEGTVSKVSLNELRSLEKHTEQVIANNLIRPGLESKDHPEFKNPGIKHVIYIIKENRTFDNVLGDIERANGDPSICLFPKKVTPNQHALAERFVILDNFHVCAEVSQDGWVWSTAGMINAYTNRNTLHNYSGRGRNYDTEGSNNQVPVDLIDIPDVTRPPSGYIWEHCKKNGVTYRNYGFFTQFTDSADKRFDVINSAKDNGPAKKALVGMTNDTFRRYDLAYADSEAYDQVGHNFPQQLKEYKGFKSRFSSWNAEFKKFVAAGSMPKFQMVRFGSDHTNGTRDGYPVPQAMVADNDYAVGQLVEAVSNSPFWKDTVICILEDDAQAGLDHVDAHRSTAYVISPYVKRSMLDSRFYNTNSMLRTMGLVLGMPAMSQYDAVASPIDVFGKTPDNIEPFKAILPPAEILKAVNTKASPNAKLSAKISRFTEESDMDEKLNMILWQAIKGKDVPMPKIQNGLRTGGMEDED